MEKLIDLGKAGFNLGILEDSSNCEDMKGRQERETEYLRRIECIWNIQVEMCYTPFKRK